MTIKRVKVWAWACRCERCGHVWTMLGDEPPTRCSRCKSRHFDKPARWQRPDRKSGAKPAQDN